MVNEIDIKTKKTATNNLTISYTFNSSDKFKKSITISIIECQMNIIKNIENSIRELNLLPKSKFNLEKINGFNVSLLYEKYKIIEFLGNLEPITQYNDFKKIKAIKKECVKNDDAKFVLITSALIDILFEEKTN